MAIANELNINLAPTDLDLANTIFGSGIQVISASFAGDITNDANGVARGIYTGAQSTIPGVVPGDSGVILSTGNLATFTNGSGTTNTNTAANAGVNNGGIDGDAQLNALAGQATFDAAILNATFIPDGNYITMQFVFTSEEYPEYINQNVNDTFGVWVNGTFVPVSIAASGNVAIDTVNQNLNRNLYRDNTGDQFNTEMDGITYTLSFKAKVNAGVQNTIKIGIADGGDSVFDSNVLIMADSIQSYALAFDDNVQMLRNSTRTVDVLANDRDVLQGGLTITHVMGQPIVVGQTITLVTGETVRLNANGTLTVTSDNDLGTNNITYTIVDSAGNTDIGYLALETVAAVTPDGIVQGTAAGDLIDTSYLGDPDGDRVDNNDGQGFAGTTGNADYILAGDGNDTVLSGLGNDIIFAGNGADSVVAGDGNDTVGAGAGNDTVFGGAGNDYVELDQGNDVFGTFGADSAGNDTVFGGIGNDSIIGGADNDVLYGGAGADTLSGGSGSDSVFGGADADQFNITDDHNTDTIFGGEAGIDTDRLAFANFVGTNGVNVQFSGNEAGTYSYAGGASGSFAEIEQISVTNFNDTVNGGAASAALTLFGNDGADVLISGAGADSIDGGTGNDVITTNAGADMIVAGSGNDSVFAGADNDSVLGDAGADSLSGGDGTDTLSGGADNDTVSGDAGNDLLNGDAGLDSLFGGDGADVLFGGADADSLNGGSGADSLFGGAGADTMTGGDDQDVFFGGAGDVIDGGEGGVDQDVLVLNLADVAQITYGGGNNEAGTVSFVAGGTLSFANIETITYAGPVDGTAASEVMAPGYVDVNGDQIDGADGNNDTIFGNAGDDTITAGLGDDLVFGGAGADQIVIGVSTGADTVTGGETAETGLGDVLNFDTGTTSTTVTFTGSEAGTATTGSSSVTFSDIETIVTAGGNDTINAGAATTPVTVLAGGGTDSIIGGTGADTIDGQAGNDDISTGDGNDSILGGAGNDTIYGGTGNDIAYGEDGDDFIWMDLVSDPVAGNNDTVYGGTGNDTIYGRYGDDLIYAGIGNDVLHGGPGADTVYGEAGDDALNGGVDAAVDQFFGGAGSDTLRGDDGADLLDGGDDNDLVYGGNDADQITGGAGLDTLFGDAGNDTILGDAGNDEIFGGAGDDSVDGGADQDSLYGNAGKDTLNGGTGNDLLFGGDDADALSGGAGNDIAEGDAGDDALNGDDGDDSLFGGAGADTLTGGLGADSLIGGDDQDVFYGGAGDVIDGSETGVDQDVLVLENVLNVAYGGGNNEAGIVTFTDLTTLAFSNIETLQFSGRDGIVNGTGAIDLIGAGFVDVAGDAIDANDALLPGEVGDDDIILAADGDDTVLAGAGSDDVFAGNGNDSVSGGDGNDNLLGEAGSDSLNGDAGNDSLFGGDGNDSLSGGNGTDSLYGGDGSDSLSGGADNDTLNGDLGDDVLNGDAGADVLMGDAGTDTLYGGTGDDVLYGGVGADQLFAGAGIDTLFGGDDRDQLFAGFDGSFDGGSGGDDYDQLYLASVKGAGIAYTITYDPGNPEAGTIQFFDANGDPTTSLSFTEIEKIVPCFTPGTLIATDRGDVPVERLRVGDLVLTRDHGLQPVRWTGRRDLGLADLLVQPALQPVRIAAGALGGGLPLRDMLVSPQHRMLVEGAGPEIWFGTDEVLVAALHMIGQPGVTRAQCYGVSYIHILCDAHEIILANGAWTESFQPAARMLDNMDDAQRAELLALFPDLYDQPSFPAARRSLKAHEARILKAA